MLVCEKNKCVGCGACVIVCKKNAIHICDSIEALNAEIDDSKCVHCNMCKNVCQVKQGVSLSPVRLWKQGWAMDNTIRENSASGGVATAIIKAFISEGGTVFACHYSIEEQQFIIDLVNEEDTKFKVPGSKYVKSNAIKAYVKVKEALIANKLVLFVGLPCQVYALKNLIPSEIQEKLFTIDLICHGTPSPILLNKYCEEHKLFSIRDLKFRAKKKSEVNKKYTPISPVGIADSYLVSFVKSINYYKSCYECKFAGIQRCSDLTLGDSWGSELSKDEIEKGISLLLIQSAKGEELISRASLHLADVNEEKAIEYNAQLRAPEHEPKERQTFLKAVSNGESYEWAVFRSFPIIMIKQIVKKVLSFFHCYRFKGDAKYKMSVKK